MEYAELEPRVDCRRTHAEELRSLLHRVRRSACVVRSLGTLGNVVVAPKVGDVMRAERDLLLGCLDPTSPEDACDLRIVVLCGERPNELDQVRWATRRR